MRIRPEKDSDIAEIRTVTEAAFEGTSEANLVDALRREANVFISLVAETDARVVGHICFTDMEFVRGGDRSVDDVGTGAGAENMPMIFGLAPMAVLPQYQRQGVGSMLAESGLSACRKRGAHAVVVLGHPEYYPRFGFTRADSFGLQTVYDVPPEAFMALELTPGALSVGGGLVRYHSAFARFA